MSHRILSLTDDALVAYLVGLEGDAGDATDIYAAKRASLKVLPCTIVESGSWSAPDGQEWTGNCLVETSISVKTPIFPDNDETAAEKRSDSDARIEATFDAFYNMEVGDAGDVAALVNAAAAAADPVVEWTAFAIRATGGERAQLGDAWIDVLNLQILCAPSVIS